jgi:hypothetical protein
VPRLPIRIMLFLSSYAPLLWLLAYRSRECTATWVTLTATGLVAVAVLIYVLRIQRGQGDAAIVIRSWQTKDSDTLGYIATYLLPFLALDLSKRDDLVALVVFLVVLGIVYCNSGMLFTNPVMTVLGYHLYEITDEIGQPWTLVTKRDTLSGVKSVQPARVGQSLIRIEA